MDSSTSSSSSSSFSSYSSSLAVSGVSFFIVFRFQVDLRFNYVSTPQLLSLLALVSKSEHWIILCWSKTEQLRLSWGWVWILTVLLPLFGTDYEKRRLGRQWRNWPTDKMKELKQLSWGVIWPWRISTKTSGYVLRKSLNMNFYNLYNSLANPIPSFVSYLSGLSNVGWGGGRSGQAGNQWWHLPSSQMFNLS